MAKREIFIIFTFVALVLTNEIEDVEQKKRGAGKANPLNAIPTGAQKPDYTYNIYSQNPSVQSPSQNYQNAQNSFYPSQEANSYYGSVNSGEPSSNPSHSQVSVPSQPTQSQFVPINFIPNPGYQSKYQIIPTKSSGNIQLAIVQPQTYPSSPIVQYPHGLFSGNLGNHLNQPGHPLLNPFASGQFAFNPHFQPLPLGGHFNQPSAMILLPQTHPSLYNNLLHPNPSQSFYNYYPSTSQAKYSYSSGAQSQPEYDKGQQASQGIQKEESDLNVQSSEYITPADASTGYKSNYSRRSAFTKFK